MKGCLRNIEDLAAFRPRQFPFDDCFGLRCVSRVMILQDCSFQIPGRDLRDILLEDGCGGVHDGFRDVQFVFHKKLLGLMVDESAFLRFMSHDNRGALNSSEKKRLQEGSCDFLSSKKLEIFLIFSELL